MRRYNFWTRRTALLLAAVCLMLLSSKYFNGRCEYSVNVNPRCVKDGPVTLDFVPRIRFADCDDFFTRSALINTYNMSDSYWKHYPAFREALGRHSPLVGHTGIHFKITMAIHYLASRPTIRTICETGFNAGHSSFNFLTANSKAIVHSFDTGYLSSSRAMSSFLKTNFGHRFFIHFGNSVKTLPTFIRMNPEFRCDLILVDGGHSYDVAYADMRNFLSIVNKSNCENYILMDGYPQITTLRNDLAYVWEDMRRNLSVTELMRCSFRHSIWFKTGKPKEQYREGFIIGQFTPE